MRIQDIIISWVIPECKAIIIMWLLCTESCWCWSSVSCWRLSATLSVSWSSEDWSARNRASSSLATRRSARIWAIPCLLHSFADDRSSSVWFAVNRRSASAARVRKPKFDFFCQALFRWTKADRLYPNYSRNWFLTELETEFETAQIYAFNYCLEILIEVELEIV